MSGSGASMEFQQQMIAALPKVRRAAMVWTRSTDLADDLVQDTVIKALTYHDKFQPGTNIGAWMCFIAKNTFLSGKRRSWRSVEMPDGLAENIPCFADPRHALDLADALEAISYLPSEQREALEAVAIGGASYEEAAEVLGAEVGTVKSRVSRGRQALDAYFGTNTDRGTE